MPILFHWYMISVHHEMYTKKYTVYTNFKRVTETLEKLQRSGVQLSESCVSRHHEAQIRTSLKPFWYRDTMVLRGLRGTFNRAVIMLRNARLSDNRCDISYISLSDNRCEPISGPIGSRLEINCTRWQSLTSFFFAPISITFFCIHFRSF